MDALLAATPLFWLFWLAWLPDVADVVAVVLLGWLAAAVVLGLVAHRRANGGAR